MRKIMFLFLVLFLYCCVSQHSSGYYEKHNNKRSLNKRIKQQQSCQPKFQ